MKTKELARILLACDPSGELEVTCGNRGVIAVVPMPGYYDGCAKIAIHDAQGQLIGARIDSKATKVDLMTFDLACWLMDYPDLPVEFDEYSEKNYGAKVEEWRKESRELDAEIKQERLAEKRAKDHEND